VLRAVDAATAPDDPADGWGEIWTHFNEAEGTPSQFAMLNFDRSAAACQREGWLSVEDDERSRWISLTPAGRAALKEKANG